MADFSYVSFCWSIGTTSFRTKDFNRKIEEQLSLMQEFRSRPENIGKLWTANNALQTDYYYFMQEMGFVEGEASRPDKDAREKTSGLKDMGLLDEERNLTEAGEQLLSIAESGDFDSDNFLEIPKDSYIYFKQLFKLSLNVGGHNVRPFAVTLYFLSELQYLSYEEFTFLLPLCTSQNSTEMILHGIKACRAGEEDIDDLIGKILLSKENYRKALAYFLQEPVTEQVIQAVGMNRKSGKYDLAYYRLYKELHQIVFEGKTDVLPLYEAVKNTKTGIWWRKVFFRSTARSVLRREGKNALHDIPLLKANKEKTFKTEFFKLLHLVKAKATLSDYFDLNRRYMKATDVLLFSDSKVELDILPGCYAADVKDAIKGIMHVPSTALGQNITLEEIAEGLAFVPARVYSSLSRRFGCDLQDVGAAKAAIEGERYRRFNRLIDSKFTPPQLIKMFDCFEKREDDRLRELITDNADIPTLFEYCLGVAWYIFSGRKGKVLEYMNLSLESDLLPKTHAGGGEADIVWPYEACKEYPRHTLLIEATLAEKTNQRRMEMEPVSRHLGEYLLANPHGEAYCVFVTTALALQVIADFRGHKDTGYWKFVDEDEISVKELKIIPLETGAIKYFLQQGFTYGQLYEIFSRAHANDMKSPKSWYENNIVKETEMQVSYLKNG